MSAINRHPLTINDTGDYPRVLLVPLSRGKGYAQINEEDLARLHSNGYVGKWFLNANASGNAYVRLYYGDNNKNVATLIMDPPPGYVVRYRNNDRKDLRRCNLILQSRNALKAENLGKAHG